MVTEIKKVFRQVALCNPQVRCELMSSDLPIITLPSGSLQDRIIDVVGKHIRTNLLEVDVDTSIVKIKGYVGRPAAAKQKNTEQYLFVNGRYFRSPQIYRAIMKAYEKLIPEICSPSYFIYLTVEPDRVDVNVSPHKTEVRFADAEDVNQIVSAAVRSTLAKSGSVGMMEFEQAAVEIPVLGGDDVVYAEPKVSDNADYNPFREDYVTDVGGDKLPPMDDFSSAIMRASKPASSSPRRASNTSYSDMGVTRLQDMMWGGDFDIVDTPAQAPQSFADSVMPSSYSSGIDLSAFVDEQESQLEFTSVTATQQLLGVEQSISFSDVMPLSGGYVIAVNGGRSMVVDVRRVKERLLYDGYMAMLKSGSCASQKLLFPEELILSDDDFALLQEHEVEFAALGFDMEFKGEGRVVICGVPANVVAEQIDALLYELLREVESSNDAYARIKEDMARVMAVKGSRQVSKVTREEAQEILNRLCECENYSFSPSGKPIMAELTLEELKSKLN